MADDEKKTEEEPTPDKPGDDPTSFIPTPEEVTNVEEILRELQEIEGARQLGFDVEPNRGQLMDYLNGIFAELDAMEASHQRSLQVLETSPYLRAISGSYRETLEAEYQDRLTHFWDNNEPVLDYFRSYLGLDVGAGKQAERPGDPLTQYFQAWERMQAELMGPFPEARFMNIPWVKEAIDSLTPTEFEEYLETSGPALQSRYMAEMFEQFGPQLETYGAELAKLSEYDEASDSYPRFERFLTMREEFGLDFVPSYEQFVEEKIPEMETRFKYLRPMSDEEANAAFRNVFGTALGEGGGQITPFGTFVGGQQARLESEFSDLVREQLRTGAESGTLPSYEEFLTGQAGELERTYQMTSPYVTGRRRPGALARPTRKL